LSTKIHALVDALGNPLRFQLTPGQAHDLIGADALLPQMAAEVLIADKAYDADGRVLELLASAGKSAVIPPGQESPRAEGDARVHRATGTQLVALAIANVPGP
jgi:transposase